MKQYIIKINCLFSILILGFTPLKCVSQNGSKVEPKRIAFEKGEVVLSGELSSGGETAFVFSATKGQKLSIRNELVKIFKFRLTNPEFEAESDFDGSLEYRFDLPTTGDYVVFVTRKPVKSTEAARFKIRLEIR